MMTGGACGAFVHGLEDEYYEVREAAIKAICVLCLTSTKLAMKALDFLADMFNDEIDSVRYEPRSHRHLANSREPAGLAPPLPPSPLATWGVPACGTTPLGFRHLGVQHHTLMRCAC